MADAPVAASLLRRARIRSSASCADNSADEADLSVVTSAAGGFKLQDSTGTNPENKGRPGSRHAQRSQGSIPGNVSCSRGLVPKGGGSEPGAATTDSEDSSLAQEPRNRSPLPALLQNVTFDLTGRKSPSKLLLVAAGEAEAEEGEGGPQKQRGSKSRVSGGRQSPGQSPAGRRSRKLSNGDEKLRDSSESLPNAAALAAAGRLVDRTHQKQWKRCGGQAICAAMRRHGCLVICSVSCCLVGGMLYWVGMRYGGNVKDALNL